MANVLGLIVIISAIIFICVQFLKEQQRKKEGTNAIHKFTLKDHGATISFILVIVVLRVFNPQYLNTNIYAICGLFIILGLVEMIYKYAFVKKDNLRS